MVLQEKVATVAGIPGKRPWMQKMRQAEPLRRYMQVKYESLNLKLKLSGQNSQSLRDLKQPLLSKDSQFQKFKEVHEITANCVGINWQTSLKCLLSNEYKFIGVKMCLVLPLWDASYHPTQYRINIIKIHNYSLKVSLIILNIINDYHFFLNTNI